MSRRAQATVCSCLLLAAIVAVFGRGVSFGSTICDDDGLVFANPVQAHFGWRELAMAFDPRAPRDRYGAQYTPLSDISYALDRRLFGERPGPYHLQGMIFHGLATLCLFALVRRLGVSTPAALLAAGTFAVHPVQVESVVWISGRRTAMAGALTLATLLVWRGTSGRASAGSLALAVLANLSKQSAVVTAPLLLLVDRLVPVAADSAVAGGPAHRRTGLAYALHAMIAVLFTSVGLWVGIREGVVRSRALPTGLRLELPLLALARYAHMLVWPANLQCRYRFSMPGGILSAPLVLGGVVAIGIPFLGMALRKRFPVAALGLLGAFLALAPALHAGGSQVLADRYLYLPLAGVSIALACAFEVAGRREVRPGGTRRRIPWMTGAVGVAMVAGLATASAFRVGVFESSTVLFEDLVAKDPTSHLARRFLGISYGETGRLAESEAQLRHAASLAASDSDARADLVTILDELGEILERRGDLGEAESALSSSLGVALEGGVAIDEAALARGRFFVRRGDRVRARSALEEGIRYAPGRAQGCREALAHLGRDPPGPAGR